jgi:mannitol/fructose-specific phosphotransferase system IIA component (Ntr-type)
MKPSALLDESKIVLNIASATSKAELMRLLVTTAVGDEADSVPILEDLLAREAKMTTGIGQGIAIPHTRSPILGKAVAALGISPGGVDFEAVDEEPVHIIFAFITPSSEPGLHMQTLAAVAALFSDAGVREAIRRSASPAEAIETIRAHGG